MFIERSHRGSVSMTGAVTLKVLRWLRLVNNNMIAK